MRLLVAKKRPLDALLHLHTCDQSCRLTGHSSSSTPNNVGSNLQSAQHRSLAPTASHSSSECAVAASRSSSLVTLRPSPSCASCLRPTVADLRSTVLSLLVARKRPLDAPFALALLRSKQSFDSATRQVPTPNNVGSSQQSAQHRSPAPTASHSSSICAVEARRSSSLFTLRPSPSCVPLASVPVLLNVWSRRLDEALCCLRRKKGRASDSLDPDRSTLQPVNAPTIKHPLRRVGLQKRLLSPDLGICKTFARPAR